MKKDILDIQLQEIDDDVVLVHPPDILSSQEGK